MDINYSCACNGKKTDNDRSWMLHHSKPPLEQITLSSGPYVAMALRPTPSLGRRGEASIRLGLDVLLDKQVEAEIIW